MLKELETWKNTATLDEVENKLMDYLTQKIARKTLIFRGN